MNQLGCDLILGINTLNELRIVLNFQVKETDIDEVTLPMREILKPLTRANIKAKWVINSNIMIMEPKSIVEATQLFPRS